MRQKVITKNLKYNFLRFDKEKNIEIRVIYEDDDLLVVDKQAGLVVHPGAGNETGTLVNGLLGRWPDLANVGSLSRPGIVHRLDRGTSGLLVVAKTQKAYDSLTAQFSDRSTGRRYLALVWGKLEAESGSVDAPIGRSKKDRVRMAVISSGKTARTNYEVDQRWSDPEVTLLKCKLETGRTHQIRVHLNSISNPIICDSSYGGGEKRIKSYHVKHTNFLQKLLMSLNRVALHAYSIEFIHPQSQKINKFIAPIPQDFNYILEMLENYNND